MTTVHMVVHGSRIAACGVEMDLGDLGASVTAHHAGGTIEPLCRECYPPVTTLAHMDEVGTLLQGFGEELLSIHGIMLTSDYTGFLGHNTLELKMSTTRNGCTYQVMGSVPLDGISTAAVKLQLGRMVSQVMIASLRLGP